MDDPHNLSRFLEAQAAVYDSALGELRSGLKQSHWMWFIFPQLRGLGRSTTAKFYGIGSAEEGHSYLEHQLLGGRLRECAEALLPWGGRRSAEQILGIVDSVKLKSSVTLFDALEPQSIFARCLDTFFRSERDELTLALLNASR
jgi:uncharacterized protein (DUF1810 family)